MGRSQVLYNRTKGRFRSKARSNQTQQQSEENNNRNDQQSRGQHHNTPKQEIKGDEYHDATTTDSSYKKRSRSRSSIGPNTTINESEMLLLADSVAPQYYVEDDSTTTIFGKDKPKEAFAMSASSLDIASLETTLLTCVSIADRLKLPSHVAQSLQKKGSSIVVTVSSKNNSGNSSQRVMSGGNDARGEQESDDMIQNARLRKNLVGESPTKSTAANIAASPELTVRDSKEEEDSFLATLSVDDDESDNDVIRPSYSGIQERDRAPLPAAPSLVHGGTLSVIQQKYNKKKDSDDASYSIGPNKIRATEEGDIEVRIKKDDASRQSREFDVDRYAIIEEDDEDSFMTSDDARLPNNMRNVHVRTNNRHPPTTKTRNKVAAVKPTGKLDPPTTTKDPPAGAIPSLAANPSDDSEMLENWLDDVVGDAASSAAVHPPVEGTTFHSSAGRDGSAARQPTGKKNGPPVSIVQGFGRGGAPSNMSTMADAMPKEVTIPQRPMVPVDPRPIHPQEEEEEEVEDTLESWLDDVIM